MNSNLLSVVIPSRNDPYLQRTVDDLLQKAKDELEVIVVLDGVWPTPMIKDHPRVVVVHHGQAHQSYGMRDSINRGVSIARGEYIMKVDEHCSFDEGFDVKLKANCQDNWLVTPRRYNLDVQTWGPFKGTATDNMSFKYPYLDLYRWRSWHDQRQKILIDDCMAMQGSCYFMSRKHWNWLGGLDSHNYGKFHYESQEICLKTWLGGGRVVTNKKTWYAHWYRRAKGYSFSNTQYKELYENKNEATKYTHDFWLNNRWDKKVHDFEWLVEKFWPVPYWPEDWKQQISTIEYGVPTRFV